MSVGCELAFDNSPYLFKIPIQLILKNIQDDVARLAGHSIMEIYEKDFSVFEKEDQSPLTEADLISRQEIPNEIKRD